MTQPSSMRNSTETMASRIPQIQNRLHNPPAPLENHFEIDVSPFPLNFFLIFGLELIENIRMVQVMAQFQDGQAKGLKILPRKKANRSSLSVLKRRWPPGFRMVL